MGMKTKVVLTTLVVGILAFLLAPNAPWTIWPKPADLMPPPTPTEVNLFMLLGVFDALSLGLGIACLIFGWPLVTQVAAPARGRAVIIYLSTAWGLGNWWVHDALHMVNGMNPTGLLRIEYGFHVTLIISGAALAYAVATMVTDGSISRAPVGLTIPPSVLARADQIIE